MNTSFTDWGGNETLAHYGVLGMKWGQRRFQNPDGSLTAAGKKHYDQTGEYGYRYHSHATKKYYRKAKRVSQKISKEMDRLYKRDPEGLRKAYKTNSMSPKLIKLDQKLAKYKRRAERSAELDKREQANANQVSTGRALATRFLIGGNMSKGYQQMLAMSNTSIKGGSTGAKTVARIASYYGGTTLSRIMKAGYIRQGEKNSKLGRMSERIQLGQARAAKGIDVGKDYLKRKTAP